MTPDLPQEIIDKIIDEVALDGSSETRGQTRDMKTFSLVSSKFCHRSRKYLFQSLEITSDDFPTWCKDIRLGKDGPSQYVAYLRYKPSWLEAERKIGPLEGLGRSPSHMSAFTHLRTLHFVDISLQHSGYLTCFGVLAPIVRELWLEDCRMDIAQFVSFVRPFTNLECLRLMRPRSANESKLQHWDVAEPPLLKGTLEFHQPVMATSANIASFIHDLSLLPAHFSTIAFRERLDTPTAANRLLAASRNTLTKLTFGHNSIPKGINLKPLDVLRELELSTLVVQVLPSIIHTVRSENLQSIRFFLLVHQLENEVEGSIRQSWLQLDLELCALADRLQATNRYNRKGLQVKFVDFNPITPAWMVEEMARVYLPRSQEHGCISFSVG